MSATDNQDKRLAAVRKAKQAMAEEFGACDWFRGVGIARRGDEWILRLNVDPAAEEDVEPPTEFAGIPIDVVHMGVYRKRQPSRPAWAGAVRPAKKKTGRRTKKK